MPQALSLRVLVAALVAVVAVIVTAGPLRSQLAAQGVSDARSLVAARAVHARTAPWSRSRRACPTAVPNGAAIWVHGEPLARRRGRAVPRGRHPGERRADASPRPRATRSC